jgi:hypothetical protein
MIFGGNRDGHSHPMTVVRDVVEVVAILAAGVWAFYVFAYENRIKPSMATPEVDVASSIQRLSERNGLIAVGVRLQLHNIGTVKAHFLGVAINVYGQRVAATQPRPIPAMRPLQYEYDGFYRADTRVPVFSYAYVTQLGDPSTTEDTELDPGTTVENYRTFYVPKGRFDLLTVGIEAPYTKFEGETVPTHLVVHPRGDVSVVTKLTPEIEQFNILPVASIDVR